MKNKVRQHWLVVNKNITLHDCIVDSRWRISKRFSIEMIHGSFNTYLDVKKLFAIYFSISYCTCYGVYFPFKGLERSVCILSMGRPISSRHHRGIVGPRQAATAKTCDLSTLYLHTLRCKNIDNFQPQFYVKNLKEYFSVKLFQPFVSAFWNRGYRHKLFTNCSSFFPYFFCYETTV